MGFGLRLGRQSISGGRQPHWSGSIRPFDPAQGPLLLGAVQSGRDL